ncbi:hypothetical protein GIB67_002657 [Kingdonia uniflora]|uniref:glutathione transferase n=1 Tax=Kingdonia uniflora TaxID=39325 RepID=A0A7J7LJI7_9MAGN|nr:hypothetical protein GIB67_002657 [Kingdonia uniflora]
MADEVTLLDFWPSPFGMRVRLALTLKGIDYIYKEENLQQKSDLLLKSNPIHKKIPTMIHNGNPISESLIMVQYIDETWPKTSSLLPSDPYGRSQSRFWADYVDKKVYDCGRRTCFAKSPEEGDAAVKELLECLKVVECELGEKLYFGGENLGYVDVALVPFYSWFYAYESFGGLSIRDECPKIVAWAKRCLENESVAKSLPDQQKVYEFVVMMRKKFGVE